MVKVYSVYEAVFEAIPLNKALFFLFISRQKTPWLSDVAGE